MAPGKQVKSVGRKGFVGFMSSRESLAQGFPSSGRGREGRKGLSLPASARGPSGEGLARAPLSPRWLESRKVPWEVASSFSSKSMIQFSSSEAAGVRGLGLVMPIQYGGEWYILGAEPSPAWTLVCAPPASPVPPPPLQCPGSRGSRGAGGGLSLLL